MRWVKGRVTQSWQCLRQRERCRFCSLDIRCVGPRHHYGVGAIWLTTDVHRVARPSATTLYRGTAAGDNRFTALRFDFYAHGLAIKAA